MLILCITTVILVLIIGAIILGWKYLSEDYCREVIRDTRLDDINIITSNMIGRFNEWHGAKEEDKYKYILSYNELETTLYSIYKISTRSYISDNNND